MTPHIEAKPGAVAESILLPGDPLRAQYIADNFLENVVCYNKVRNMLGFTGTYKGVSVSVQGTGMGIPSISIYAQELMEVYGCKNLIRVGTAGSIHHSVKVRDIVMGTAASTTSAVNRGRFGGFDYAPVADFTLAMKAFEAAQKRGYTMKTGPILSSDLFYGDDPKFHEVWAKYGVLAIEMEAAGLYTLAAKFNARALCLATISDHILTGESTTPAERQGTFTHMMEIALDAIVALK